MTPSRLRLVLPLVILTSACTRVVQGPVLATDPPITTILVEPLDTTTRHPVTIVDQAIIERSLYLFAGHAWEENDDVLVPTHRIQLFRQDGSTLTYWLGSLSNPPRFPCYSFCSGWWVAAANPDGSLRPSMRHILASSVQMFDVGTLLIPTNRGSQPNQRVQQTMCAPSIRLGQSIDECAPIAADAQR